MATTGNYIDFMEVESISPSSPVSPPPNIGCSMTFDDSNHNLDLETPHLISTDALNDISFLVNKCLRKHSQVIQRHCVIRGINFNLEDTTRFLIENHLNKAFVEAEKESIAFLEKLLKILIAQDKTLPVDHEDMKAKLSEQVRMENSRIQAHHAYLQAEFIKKAKCRVWTEFVEKVEISYYFLFHDFNNANHRQFYNHDKMKQHVIELIGNSKENCKEYRKMLEGNPENGDRQHGRVRSIYDPFQDFMSSIKNATEDLIAKNQKNETYSRKHIIDNLIEKEYGLKRKSKLKEVIEKESHMYFNNIENIRKVDYRELKEKAVQEITAYVNKVCLEEPKVFQKTMMEELDRKDKELIHDGLEIAKQKEEEIKNTYNELIESDIPIFTAKIAKRLPAADIERLRIRLLEAVERVREDRKSGSAIASSMVSTGKHPSGDNNDLQTPSTGKRVRTSSSSSSSSTNTSASSYSANKSRGRESLPIKIALKGNRQTRP